VAKATKSAEVGVVAVYFGLVLLGDGGDEGVCCEIPCSAEMFEIL